MIAIFRRLLLPALLIALLPAVTAAPPRKAAAPAATRDWSQVATRTSSGSFVQGNPAAKVRLVEFLSFTCPHCARFEEGAQPALTQRYIKTGLVSYEVRIALRDPFDLAAAVLARCGGPRAFFAVKPAVYAAQNTWLTKGQEWGATNPKLEGLSEAQAGKAVAAGAGLDTFFLSHGLTRPQIEACLGNVAEQKALSAAAQQIWQPGFPGTPAFLINGVQTDGVASWSDLEPKLKKAIG